MNQIPITDAALIVRGDFSNDSAWEKLCSIAANPPDPFMFTMQTLDDRQFDGITADEMLSSLSEDYPHNFIVLADATALKEPDYPLLVIDLLENPGRQFRCEAIHIASIDSNLSIANMGFEEFAGAVDESGVFRGFPE